MKRVFIISVFICVCLLNCNVIAAPEWLNDAEIYVNDQLIGHTNQYETTYPDPILVKINDKIKAKVQVKSDNCGGNLTIGDTNDKKTEFEIPANSNSYKQVTFIVGNWGKAEKNLWMEFSNCHDGGSIYFGNFRIQYE
jgi:hypothetical protein